MGLIEFVFKGGTDGDQLGFRNSCGDAPIRLLGAHDHHTYTVDVRYYPDFSLSAFLAEHPVDDILVMGENSVVFSSGRYQISPGEGRHDPCQVLAPRSTVLKRGNSPVLL